MGYKNRIGLKLFGCYILTHLGSFSSTFYEQLLRQYSCAEKFQTASTEIFRRKNIGAKAAHKMLMKLTPSYLSAFYCIDAASVEETHDPSFFG